MNAEQSTALRSIPSVSAILADERVVHASGGLLPDVVSSVVRRRQNELRSAVLRGEQVEVSSLPDVCVADLRVLSGSHSPLVINGSGVIVQTNLGRAPVSAESARAMADVATHYSALETDLETGERGGRGSDVQLLMRALAGAERTLVVNNNAAAVMLTLAATCSGRRVVVSRGEAVEIGGGFRAPDVLQQSGATLAEVGTTNRTYARDYAEAIDSDTAALLRVHASNFAVIGFTARPDLVELVALAHERGILALEDVGSGCLLQTETYGLEHEPTLRESIEAGVDVVCASGDKLLGGPQAGLIIGKADVVQRIARHPLARAVRADKTALAGIAATLRHYVRGDATESIPVWWSISRSTEWLEQRVQHWCDAVGHQASVVRTEAVVGGGSLPGRTLPSYALAIDPGAQGPNALAKRLRVAEPHVIARVFDGLVLIDARTVLHDEDDQLLKAIRAAMARG